MTLREWFGFCKHEWAQKDVLNVVAFAPDYQWYSGTERPSRVVGRRYIQECAKCKQIRNFEVSL